jgi:glycine/D-amino acid oxidase-like deaminating enzyme
MRTCIIGGGLAGTLLAWRLAGRPEVERIDLHLGGHTTQDATDASGGVVRGFEAHPGQRRLAIESLSELLGSRVLREWSAFRPLPSLYLRPNAPGLAADLREIWTEFPGSARLVGAEELLDLGWADLPRGTVGILEHAAGYLSPGALRGALLADLTMRRVASVSSAAVDAVAPQPDGTVACTASGHRRDYDVVVIAAGAWTLGLLAASGLPCNGYRTKSVQYTIYSVAGYRPLPFFDETSGLYGRPTPNGGMLLGLATGEWDVAPGRRPLTADLHADAARIAGIRLPLLELGPVQSSVNATDCYCDPPMLGLRRACDPTGSVWTFTGGSGGAAKTALAASLRASQRLIDTTQHGNILDPMFPELKVSQP